MAPRRIFVTGATGNVGSAVCRELLRRGDEVTALSRRRRSDIAATRVVIADLTRITDVSAHVIRADAIIHCASPRTESRRGALREDIAGTAELLDLWQTGNFVLTSSQTVYGVPNKVLCESDPPVSSSWYDVAKVCNEQTVQMSAHVGQRGAGVSLRLPLIFAAGPRRRDRQFLPSVHDALRAGRTFLFKSDAALESAGSVFIGENDVGRALAEALTLRQSGPYNVAGGFCTWRELLNELGRQTKLQPKILLRADARPGPDEFRLPQSRSDYDCGRFCSVTGFAPSESLEDLVARFLRAEQNERRDGRV